jgi:hypothetical protein
MTGTYFGPNSHFYAADAAERAALKAQFDAHAKSRVFESNDFAITPPLGATGSAASCNGSYTATVQPAGCPNAPPAGDAIVLTGIGPSRPGLIQGTATVADTLFDTIAGAAGDCRIKPGSHSDIAATLTGTWNSKTGTIVIARDGAQWTGSFTVASGRASGTLGSAAGAPGFIATFDCAAQ